MCQKVMPHFLCCVKVILVKISQTFAIVLLKENIFKNIFFMFSDSVLPPSTPEDTSVLALLPLYAQYSASAPPTHCHSRAELVKN